MKYFIVDNNEKVLFDNKAFDCKYSAKAYIENNLSEEQQSEVYVFSEKELREIEIENSYAIVDYMNEFVYFKLFKTQESAFEFLDEYCTEDEIDDVIVKKVCDVPEKRIILIFFKKRIDMKKKCYANLKLA